MYKKSIESPLLESEKDEDVKIMIKSINEININFTEYIMTLTDIGFSKDMIDNIFSLYTINSLDQAVFYMTKENDVWQHNYIESENKLCVICNEDNDHIDYKSNKSFKYHNIGKNKNFEFNDLNSQNSQDNNYKNSSPLSNNSIIVKLREKEEIKNSSKEICIICFNNAEFTYSLNCKHIFCLDCWKEYLINLINEGKVVNLPCMQKDCEYNIDDNKVNELLGDTMYQKYKKFKLNKIISTSKDMKFCPITNCGSYAKKNVNKNVMCYENSHEFCYECLKPWHVDKACSEVIDEDFEKWRKGKLIKKCPSCRFWTEKNEGCNHMTCKGCGYNWCWLCEGRYHENHYMRGGSCYGMQFDTNSTLHNACFRKIVVFWRILCDILKLVFFILLFTLFGIPCASIYLFNKIFYLDLNKSLIGFIYLILFINGLALQIPITFFIIILLSFGIGLGMIFLPCVVMIFYKLKSNNYI